MEKTVDIYHGHDAFYLRNIAEDQVQIELWSRGTFGVTIELECEDAERFAEELLAFTKSVRAQLEANS